MQLQEETEGWCKGKIRTVFSVSDFVFLPEVGGGAIIKIKKRPSTTPKKIIIKKFFFF
jgi:hypothetical protein